MSHAQVPASGNPALYTATDKTASQVMAGPEDVLWDTPDAGVTNGIPFSASSVFTLEANRVYELTAFIVTTLAGTYSFEWVDSTNTPIGAVNIPGINAVNSFAVAVFNPLVDTDVKVRLTTAIGVEVTSPSYVIIKTLD